MSNLARALVEMITAAVRDGGDNISATGGVRRIDPQEAARNEIRSGLSTAFETLGSETVVVATTDSGTTYNVRLFACSPGNVLHCTDSTTGITYDCRPCTARIKEAGQAREEVHIVSTVAGFDPRTRTIFVGDLRTQRVIRRSSTIRQFATNR